MILTKHVSGDKFIFEAKPITMKHFGSKIGTYNPNQSVFNTVFRSGIEIVPESENLRCLQSETVPVIAFYSRNAVHSIKQKC